MKYFLVNKTYTKRSIYGYQPELKAIEQIFASGVSTVFSLIAVSPGLKRTALSETDNKLNGHIVLSNANVILYLQNPQGYSVIFPQSNDTIHGRSGEVADTSANRRGKFDAGYGRRAWFLVNTELCTGLQAPYTDRLVRSHSSQHRVLVIDVHVDYFGTMPTECEQETTVQCTPQLEQAVIGTLNQKPQQNFQCEMSSRWISRR